MPFRVQRVLLVLTSWLLAGPPALADASPEYRVKAGFLYNFIVFTTWPDEVGTTLPVCIYGRDPFGAELRVIEGRVVSGRRIELRYPDTRGELKGCRVVFVPAAVESTASDLVAAVAGEPVLVVTDDPVASGEGVMIRMLLHQSRVVFEVDLAAAQRSRLSLSARLLQLATRVR